MEVIALHYPHTMKKEDFPKLALALGYFDGVHLGHQKVIQTAVNYAKEHQIKSAVMTFDPHPIVVLKKSSHIDMITSLEQKIELIRSLGVDYVFVVSFTKEFANLEPQEFVDQYLIGLNVQHVVAGFDYTYGRLGKGTMATLPVHSRGQFTQTTVEKLEKDGIKVSSSAIRSFLLNGELEKVREFLGRYFSVHGKVVHGKKRGRQLGFPTANIRLDDETLKPPVGVYAVKVLVHNKWYVGACNFGYNITFEDGPLEPQAEVYIIDFSGDIYGETIVVEWHKRLRNELKFANLDDLIAQIRQDVEDAKAVFQN
ncbi:MAG TPA: bifunctional riboflavin kinase/FAD synthetase [Bacillus sp. (in: firmicutes)]|uniref:bifunctional riboflavin kinase/FAD synthetase n=1 Tax=Bacillus litorisediminis TaxID=2922713 RepID=UPI001FAE906F|nr:bifunctional riboflavin kinase/FAD synthetase [Bacillus litorisediminis]HWO78002.1 bifunctional riboflavin kinase/FAD synthetase [Bacillus sp. (in: firmicutes)]